MPRPALVPELLCSHLDASVDFYVRVLGFAVLYERPEERFASLARAGAELMLQEPVGRAFLAGELAHPYGRGMHLQIEVADIGALDEELRSAGVEPWLPMEEAWYRRDDRLLGQRQLMVQDPDGYLLRLFEGIGERPAGSG